MDKDLRKRLEEAAEDYASKVWTNPMFLQEWDECRRDFIAGAEFGYKEAIAMACRWLQSKCDFIDGDNLLHLDFKCECFRNAMNKLWEETK